jgi:hypothetical protein
MSPAGVRGLGVLLGLGLLFGPMFIWAGIQRLRGSDRRDLEALAWGWIGIFLGTLMIGFTIFAFYKLSQRMEPWEQPYLRLDSVP